MKWLGYVGVVLVVAVAGLFSWYLMLVYQPVELTAPVVVTIPEQAGTEGATAALAEAGVIRSGWVFIVHATLTGQRTELRSGTYTLAGSLAVPQVLAIVTKQQSLQNEVEITLLEGWTSQQMGEALSQALSFTAADYTAAVQAQQLEGYLFPDTYRFFIDASVQDVIDTQVANFHTKITPELDIDVADVILASIVEKEARTLSDKQLVAGVFQKRLAAGKRLESDVTVNYITGKTAVSYADADIESAYNTYRIVGLPPGAISNPGYDALFAVAYPTTSDYWYFIATPEGDIKYSATYDEHLQLKAHYYP